MELTKIYVVQAEAREGYEDYRDWIEGIFTSEESAKKHVLDKERHYDEDMRRINELEELRDKRRDDGTYDSFEEYGLTAEEHEEYDSLQSSWPRAWRYCPFYWIEEFEVKS